MLTHRQETINADLKAFQDNPIAFMNRRPPKYDRQGNLIRTEKTLFDPASIGRKDYVQSRDDLRSQITKIEDAAPGRAAFADNDRADSFVDSYQYSGLQSMEANGLTAGELIDAPWSDDYWALYLGVLGKRYSDPNFPNSTDWKENFDYSQNNPAAAILASGDEAAIDLLSPSEKYDALVGAPQQSLTTRMWAEGARYYEASGKVEPWMGICHGWAPAAYMLPRPAKAVTVLTAEGTPLRFYPADIKALASLLWANVHVPTRFIGGRCNDKDPKRDPETGRQLSDECFDTNPGTWHLSVVNQIGGAKRSMVMDATYDYEVWNQPIFSYTYSYFNPKKKVHAQCLDEATVAITDFKNDKFRQYRSKETDSVVGIAMDVAYLVETSPTHLLTDDKSNDGVMMVRYLYDLELDMVGNIIGGEWYENAHPDFLWTPVKGSQALTFWESQTPLIESWEQNQPIPEQWQTMAKTAVQGAGVPLTAIVESLIAFAND